MEPQPSERPQWPHQFDILPLADRAISAALWVGRLFTKQVVHPPIEISDHFPDHEVGPEDAA